jgi:bacterioferritin-associated ferredoxin
VCVCVCARARVCVCLPIADHHIRSVFDELMSTES